MENELKIAQPEWGEWVTLGNLLGEPQKVHRPLNQAAVATMYPWAIAALILHDRIEALAASGTGEAK